MIDDTWPQAGEMRCLWKCTTDFWTNDMPQDCTWEANRHHSRILPLFRSHLTRDTAAMFPLLQNTVTSTEHECRDPHLPAVPHTENAVEEGRLPKLYSVSSTHHDDSSGATESQRQGRNLGNRQVHTAGVGVQRGGATFQPEDGGTIYSEQSDRSSIPTWTGDGKDVPDHETVGGELGASRSMKTGQKKRLLGGIKKTKTLWERWYETIKEEEKLQSNKDVRETTEQQGRHSTVHRFL